MFDPHSPYKPPGGLASEYRAQPYHGEVAFVDRALGPLFDKLATLSRPTLVIVTSDHGESLGEHGELTHGMFAYEATLHVPLIIARVEPGWSAGTRTPATAPWSTTPVRHIDIVPTVLEAVGAEADAQAAGRVAALRSSPASSVAIDRPTSSR